MGGLGSYIDTDAEPLGCAGSEHRRVNKDAEDAPKEGLV